MRYFFDTDDGKQQVRDEDGHECDSLEAVKYAAIEALPEFARDELPDGDRATFRVRVRDESGRYIFEAKLDFEANWLIAPPPNG